MQIESQSIPATKGNAMASPVKFDLAPLNEFLAESQEKLKKIAVPKIETRLFLIEFYTNEPDGRGGFKKNEAWDINFAWVLSEHSTKAVDKLRKQQAGRYCECITINEFAKIAPLSGSFRVNTPDSDLFIIQ